MTPKNSGSRAQLRATQTTAIKDVARRLIADKGVADLSLREVSREMGMVSSALYRYFATRDELLTALIYDAYNELGVVVERAEARVPRSQTRARWRSACGAVRKWATAHPHEYALLFGTPVPGYVAPNVTIAAATRVPTVLGRVLSDDRARSARRVSTSANRVDVRDFLQVDALAPSMPNVEPELFVRALMAWTTLFGTVSFELFGHYVGSVTSYCQMFDVVVEELADFVGLQ
jgi:AcrR family transcriptional regulator